MQQKALRFIEICFAGSDS